MSLVTGSLGIVTDWSATRLLVPAGVNRGTRAGREEQVRMRALAGAISTTGLFLSAAICLTMEFVDSRFARVDHRQPDYLDRAPVVVIVVVAGVLAFAGFVLLFLALRQLC